MREQTESCRLMRGAWEIIWEYLFELRTERMTSRLRRGGHTLSCQSTVDGPDLLRQPDVSPL